MGIGVVHFQVFGSMVSIETGGLSCTNIIKFIILILGSKMKT